MPIFHPQVIQDVIPQCGINLGHVLREIHMVFGVHSSVYLVLPSSQWFRMYESLARLSLLQRYNSKFSGVLEDSLRHQLNLQ